MADNMSIEKEDLSKDHSGDESTGSSPEAETQQNSGGNNNNAPQENQQPKRKGGRKPIYATSEERKQRNRQAQAAFRERRTEYIKQLEETIRVHEQNLHSLQTAHRHAADECLMLRYKNSLLERILLEKGIDVQAELRAKTGSPTLGPTHMPQNMIQPPPIQRALLNRHHARRSNSSIAPKLEPGVAAGPLPPPLQSPHALGPGVSPKNRPTPPSHTASPTTTSYGSQHGASPATSGSDHMTGQVRQQQHAPNNTMKAPPIPGLGNMSGAGAAGPRQLHMSRPPQTAGNPQVSGGGANTAPFYATQAYQNHIEQLGKLTPLLSPPPPLKVNSVVLDSSRVSEQEYDAAVDMIDDVDASDTPSGPGPYPGAQYGGEPQPLSLPSPVTTMPPTNNNHQHVAGHSPMDGVQHQQHPQHHHAHHHQQQQQQQHPQHQQQPQQGQQQQGGGYPSMTQLLDPALDWDPFGLSASMAFPAQFSFDTSNMR